MRLTDDDQSLLDLSKGVGSAVDILDCQLHVEGSPPTYELVHSKGRLPITQLAVKQIQDDSLVEVKVKARLSGLPVSRLWLRYSRQKAELRARPGDWAGMTINGQAMHGNAFNILIDAPAHRIVSTLKKRRGQLVVRYGALSEQDVGYRVISLFAHGAEQVDFTGYGIEDWKKYWPRYTTIDYECALGKARLSSQSVSILKEICI